MTMFTSEFWNLWVIGVTVLSIAGTAWLLWSTNRIKVNRELALCRRPW